MDSKVIMGIVLSGIAATLAPFWKKVGDHITVYHVVTFFIVALIGTVCYEEYKEKKMLQLCLHKAFIILLIGVIIILINLVYENNRGDYKQKKQVINVKVKLIKDTNSNCIKDGTQDAYLPDIDVELLDKFGREISAKRRTNETGEVFFKSIPIENFPIHLKVCGQSQSHSLIGKYLMKELNITYDINIAIIPGKCQK